MIRNIAAAAAAVLIALFVAAAPANAQFADQATAATANAGSANANTATIPNATSYADLKGVLIKITPSVGNTTAATLTINGFGSSPAIEKPTAAGLAALTGGELVAGQPALMYYDGTEFVLLSVTSTTAGAANIANSALSFGVPVNLEINAAVGSNNLTISVTGNNGSNASATNPVLIPFRDSTIVNGGPKIVSLQSALSFTINSGNTMGCVNGQMCRLWLVAICSTGLECTGSAGSDVVGLCAFNARSGTNIAPINEAALQTSASGTNGGSSAQTYYCNISAVTARAVRIIGYLDVQETTAGTWASSPTYVQLFGPGIKKPGDTVQTVYSQTGTLSSTSNTYSPSGTLPTTAGGLLVLSQAITPTSAANILRMSGQAVLSTSSGSNALGTLFIYDVTNGAVKTVAPNFITGSATSTNSPSIYYQVAPNTASAITYAIYATGDSNTTYLNGQGATQFFGSIGSTFFRIEEIMGSIEPANDNAPMSAVG